jgi:hypothetical protein
MKYIILACFPILLAGCDLEVYRYPCQDPANWDSAQCQKPQCEVSKTCPEHIFENDREVIQSVAVTTGNGNKQQPMKGGCK